MPRRPRISTEKVSPSAFMRQLRPELYSDPRFRDLLPQAVRANICPNLKPATGPEGGGDSKAETETIPIADHRCRFSVSEWSLRLPWRRGRWFESSRPDCAEHRNWSGRE